MHLRRKAIVVRHEGTTQVGELRNWQLQYHLLSANYVPGPVSRALCDSSHLIPVITLWACSSPLPLCDEEREADKA